MVWLQLTKFNKLNYIKWSLYYPKCYVFGWLLKILKMEFLFTSLHDFVDSDLFELLTVRQNLHYNLKFCPTLALSSIWNWLWLQKSCWCDLLWIYFLHYFIRHYCLVIIQTDWLTDISNYLLHYCTNNTYLWILLR